MTTRANQPPLDFQKMCQQAERDHESKKLVILLERVKQQIAVRQKPGWSAESPKPPAMAISGRANSGRRLSRSAPFDR